MLKRHSAESRNLRFVDISSPSFDPTATGKPLDLLMREIHGRRGDGSWMVGVEVFREIYRRMGFRRLVAISRWPLVSRILIRARPS